MLSVLLALIGMSVGLVVRHALVLCRNVTQSSVTNSLTTLNFRVIMHIQIFERFRPQREC